MYNVPIHKTTIISSIFCW